MTKLNACFCCLLFVITSSNAQTIYPGANAPQIKVAEWVKGEAITAFQKDHIYIVEFWATWCGPCKTAMPHLSAIANKYKGKVSVVGVSISERDFKVVAPFVSKMGDKMAYNVAYDIRDSLNPASGFMSKNWMEAAGLNGIPASFIIGKTGLIEFIGYPDHQLDSALEELINDRWDASAYDKKWRAEVAEGKKRAELQRQQYEEEQKVWNVHPVKLIMDRIQGLIKEKNYSAALLAADSLEKMDAKGVPFTPPPVLALDMRIQIFEAQENKLKLFETLDQLLEIIVKDTKTGGYALINDIIWKRVVDPASTNIPKIMRNYNFAVKWMKRVVGDSKEKDPAQLDTLAWAYFGAGDKTLAVSTEKKALELIGHDDPQRKDYEQALKTFQQ